MNNFRYCSAEEAARLIQNCNILGIGGFSSVGTPKAVPMALAEYAKSLHNNGIDFKVGLITGGAAGASVDGCLAEADAVFMRTPFQSEKNR